MLTAGSLTFRALWTPGHTPHHLAFLAEDSTGDEGRDDRRVAAGRSHRQDRPFR